MNQISLEYVSQTSALFIDRCYCTYDLKISKNELPQILRCGTRCGTRRCSTFGRLIEKKRNGHFLIDLNSGKNASSPYAMSPQQSPWATHTTGDRTWTVSQTHYGAWRATPIRLDSSLVMFPRTSSKRRWRRLMRMNYSDTNKDLRVPITTFTTMTGREAGLSGMTILTVTQLPAM